MAGRPVAPVRNVNHPGKERNVSGPHYEAMRAALLAAVPPGREVAFKDLAGIVGPRLRGGLFEGRSITWYVTTVKLDLEARGLLERVPGSRPQRLRRPSP